MIYLKLFEGYQSESEVEKICRRYNIGDKFGESWTLNSNGLVDVYGKVKLFGRGLKKIPLKFGEVTGGFFCENNQLTSLEGAPHKVGGGFSCSNNQLTNLEGAPNTVGGIFNCENNQLTSLEGAPNTVSSHFFCHSNNIRSFDGLMNIGGDFYCWTNPLFSIWEIINSFTVGVNNFPENSDRYKWDSEKMEFFNDLDIIRGEEIAIERLNFFLEEMGLDPVESVKGYKNIY